MTDYMHITIDCVDQLGSQLDVLDGYRLLSEMIQVLRPGGLIIISTPNTMSLYSRWWYFLYGYPFQFPPHAMQHVTKERAIDRGHINTMSYLRLRYLLESLGAEVTGIKGDRTKKKQLLPFLLPVFGFG